MRISMGLFCAAGVLLFQTGCGGDKLKMVPVTGTVKYKGNPVAGATVVFQPEEGPLATGTTDEQGQYTLVTRGKPGVAVGKSQVSITALEPMEDELEFDDDDPAAAEAAMTEEYLNKMAARKSLIPEKYRHPRTSGLEVVVSTDGETQHDFDLKD